jgi:hypothetical protein
VCALLLPNCGVFSSGDCADKATCVASESDAPPPNALGVDVDATDPATGTDVRPNPVGASEARAEAPVEIPRVDASSPDADAHADTDQESTASMDATGSDASNDTNSDATVRDAELDANVDVVADALDDAMNTGDTNGCGPCTNICAPSFVQCCTAEGGCGCIEWFWPPLGCQ